MSSSMSGVHRFLSRRDKKNPRRSSPSKDRDSRSSQSNHRPAHRPDHFGGVFAIEDDPKTKPDKDEEKKIIGVLERLRMHGIDTMVESNARYALRTKDSDGDAAFKLLMLLQETYEGIVRPYNPETRLVGAVNRESVTCYLDALLFAMFARLDSFEAMLYDSFDDTPRRKLAGLLRLWVNMLRTGRLITTDVTRHLQDALAQCGWADAARLRQQDPSEAFTFITDRLQLPLLTLKMDLHHAGKEDPQDDHKFINERLLEVAVVEEPSEGNDAVTLEDCLEHYFNNRIEVKRHMENQRRNTLKSADMGDLHEPTKLEKESGIHVEVAEIVPSPLTQTPIMESPVAPSMSRDPLERVRPGLGRKRGDSIFSSRKVVLDGVDPEKAADSNPPPEKERKMSTRTEVLMPAWQFFKLLPWYTDHMPTSDAQVAAHFSKKRPVLGICLKRYSYTNTGQAQRLNTYIDIPTEIAVPNFVSDEHMQEDGPLVGNFRLLLQSVVCHRGVSVNSGHYICLCRGTALNATGSRSDSEDSDELEDPWMRFDDLAKDRVTYVNIRDALKQETPYLLFYQVQPIADDGHSIHELPTYAEATSRTQSDADPVEKPYLNDMLGSENALEQMPSVPNSSNGHVGSEANDWAPMSGRPSFEITSVLDGKRGRSSFQADERRQSVTFDPPNYAASEADESVGTDPTASVPSTPFEEQEPDSKNGHGLLAVASKMTGSRRGSRVSKGSSTSKSRPQSNGPDTGANRFSLNMSKLTMKLSRSESGSSPALPTSDAAATTVVTEVFTDEGVPPDSVGGQALELENDTRKSVDTARLPDPVAKPPTKASTGSMTKKEKAALKSEKRRAKRADDRECVVM